jgi:hypothetical protein
MTDKFVISKHVSLSRPLSIELSNGRVLQIHDRHRVATTDGTHTLERP